MIVILLLIIVKMLFIIEILKRNEKQLYICAKLNFYGFSGFF